MQQVLVREFFKYLFFFFCFFVLGGANIYGLISPFAAGFALALVWCGQKLFYVLPLYAISSLILDFSTAGIITTFCFVFIIAITCGIHTKLKKTISFGLFMFYSFLALSGFLFTEIYYHANTLFAVLSVISTLLFMWASKTILGAVLLQEAAIKLRTAQKLSALVVLAALSCGLEAIAVFNVPLLQVFAPFIILLFATTKKTETTVLVAAVMGLGAALYGGNGLTTTTFVVWALCASAVKGSNKLLPAAALIASDVLCGFGIGFYPNYSYTWLIASVLGTLGFLALPNSITQKFAEMFEFQEVGMRNVVNRSRESLHKRLYSLSEVFGEMDYIFRSMIKGGMTKEQVKTFLISEVKNKTCYDCPERNMCHRKCAQDTYSVLESMISSALERGKASLLDAPAYLTKRCTRVSSLVSAINELTAQYRQYASAMNNIDASRVLIADELKGLAQILKNLANEVNLNITFDKTRENKIIAELAFHNIICADAVIYEQDIHAISATLVIRKADSTNPKISQIVSKICGSKLALASVNTSKRAGWNILTLKTAPKFAITFGTATKTKDGSRVSGDAYSIIKLSHDKFLMALCDGMGSGEKAERASSLAIGLVENFYKAGFDNEIILSSINKLLSLGSEDVFSALDICVLDTQNGNADFIKMGAPESYLKHQSTTDKVEGGTLPLGIVQDAAPSIIKQMVSSGDFVFMFTDGVSDSFETTEKLQDYINNLSSLNAQTLAENLLNKALELSGGARDDMSVIVAKIFNLN